MYNRSTSVKGHSVKTSSDRQVIAFFNEIGVAESNGNVRILIGSCEIAVCTHAQYKINKNIPNRLARRRAAFKLQCLAIATVFSYIYITTRECRPLRYVRQRRCSVFVSFAKTLQSIYRTQSCCERVIGSSTSTVEIFRWSITTLKTQDQKMGDQ